MESCELTQNTSRMVRDVPLKRCMRGTISQVPHLREGLHSAPRLRAGLPSRGTSIPLVNPRARRKKFFCFLAVENNPLRIFFGRTTLPLTRPSDPRIWRCQPQLLTSLT